MKGPGEAVSILINGTLKLAMAEMYIQSVSTRKVASVLEKRCGLDISRTQGSNTSKLLGKELEKWRI